MIDKQELLFANKLYDVFPLLCLEAEIKDARDAFAGTLIYLAAAIKQFCENKDELDEARTVYVRMFTDFFNSESTSDN